METVQEEVVAEQRLVQPLDALTRDLVEVLYQKSRLLDTLERSLRDAHRHPEVYEQLWNMHQKESESIQALEPRLRRRLHGCDASKGLEP